MVRVELKRKLFLKGQKMQIKIDIKSLVAGLIIGIVVFMAMGEVLSSADRTDYGLAIGYRGYALVRDNAGMTYVIDPQRGRANLVEHDDGPYKGRYLDLNRAVKVGEKSR